MSGRHGDWAGAVLRRLRLRLPGRGTRRGRDEVETEGAAR